MGATILRTMTPNATIYNGSFDSWAGTSIPVMTAQTPHAALSDGLATTFIYSRPVAASVDPTLEVQLTSPAALPPGIEVRFVRVNLQVSLPGGVGGVVRVELVVNGSESTVAGIVIPGATASTSVLRFVDIASRPGGGAWRDEDFQGMHLRITGPRATSILNGTRVSSAHVEVLGNHLPWATPTGPTSVTTTSLPLLTWDYYDVDGDRQSMVEARVFSGATVVDLPSSETARLVGAIIEHFSGEAIESPGLRNGTYRWAIRVKDVSSSAWGQWQNSYPIVVANPANNAPLMTVTPDQDTASYEIELDTGGGTYPIPHWFMLERSDDHGATWSFVRNGTHIPYLGVPATITDYEAPRMAVPFTPATYASLNYNAPVSYNAAFNYTQELLTPAYGLDNVVRYRATAVRSISGEEIWSEATVFAPESLLADNKTWLKHPYDPSQSIVVSPDANFDSTSEEIQSALRGMGRADWVVFGDIPSLEKGEIGMVFGGDAAWQSFEALRATASPVPLLMQTCFGDTSLEQLWIRLGPTRALTRVTHTGQRYKQYRRAKVGFHETVRPLDV